MIVIADTTPLNYLVLIGQVELLPRLFEHVLIPPAVFEELTASGTAPAVTSWLAQRPDWLQVQPLRFPTDPALQYLDQGEQEALALAEEWGADRVLLDEGKARQEALRRKLRFIGTLGILRQAARFDWIDLPSVLAQLKETSFYVKAELIESLLEEEAERKKGTA